MREESALQKCNELIVEQGTLTLSLSGAGWGCRFSTFPVTPTPPPPSSHQTQRSALCSFVIAIAMVAIISILLAMDS